jgi:hypothetical protein
VIVQVPTVTPLEFTRFTTVVCTSVAQVSPQHTFIVPTADLSALTSPAAGEKLYSNADAVSITADMINVRYCVFINLIPFRVYVTCNFGKKD